MLDEVGRKSETDSIAVSETVLANYAFDDIALNTLDSNEIYVYMGPKIVLDNIGCREYDRYKDLETTREISVRKCDVEKFEANHTVVKSDNKVDNSLFYEYLRRRFFTRIIETSQEEAVKNVLKKSKTKLK